MARTNITKQVRSRSGLTPAFAAVDASASPNGMQFDWTENAEILLKNTDTAPHTMTVQIPVTVDGQAVTAKTVTIALSTPLVVAGPYGAEYRQADGKVYINFDAATGMTIAVVDRA